MPENVGRTRLTLVDPVGFNPEDMAEYLPAISLAALEVAGGVTAGMIGTATASPQAAIFAGSAISSTLNALAVPVRNKLLKEYYDVTDEELQKYSNPDEALEQAIFAGGVELGVGQSLTLARWVRGTGSKRVLTEDDYTALTDELDKTQKLQAEFKASTGETIENPVMFVEAAAKRMDTQTGQSISTMAENLKRFLPNKLKRILANSNDVTRFKLARAWRTVTNNATEEAGHGARVGLDDNGLLVPLQDATEAAEEVLKLAEKEYGVTAARQNVLDQTDEAERAFSKVHDTVANAHYKDVQNITTNDVKLAASNEELQWNYWKSMIEPNATGTSNGIHIVNGPNSPIRRALGHLSAEAETNLSRSMGDRTQGFVEDLAAMKNGTLDIMQMHRLRSDLLRTKRQLSNSADPSGWQGTEIDDIVDAIDDTMFKQDWVRTSSGKAVPARKLEALKQYEVARESSKFVNDIARSSSVQDLIESVQVFDPSVARAVGDGADRST
jgi:hypothetical protein